MKRLLFAIMGRWYLVRVRFENVWRRRHLEAFCPGILHAFNDIERATGTRGPYIAKCWELLRLLQKHRPTFILEMGAGRTSLVFAAYATKTGGTHIAFEQDQGWRDRINQWSTLLCHVAPVQRANVEVFVRGGRYTTPLPEGADFLYVDGPFTPGLSFQTFTGKAAAMDVPLWLAEGHRPRVIAVDDRTDTVDEILTFPGYHFAGGWLWTQERRIMTHVFRPRRHSVFVAT